VLSRDPERKSRIAVAIGLVQFIVIQEIGSVAVDESTQRQSIRPAEGEILDVDLFIRLGFALAPE